MYENGRHLNRHANMLRHKRNVKNRYLRTGYFNRSWGSWKDYEAHKKEYDSDRYWVTDGRNGRRRYAAQCSKKKVRSAVKAETEKADAEEMALPNRGQYKKLFDYAWTIW